MSPQMQSQNKLTTRPVVFDYGAPHQFLDDLLKHYKATSEFSIRQKLDGVVGCSPALVSGVLNGKRRLTRDQLPTFARVFELTGIESSFLDEILKVDVMTSSRSDTISFPVRKKSHHTPKNHILSSWLHVYVKDLIHLRGFRPDSKLLFKMLMSLASPDQIERSIKFLLREGFWRKTARGDVVAEEALLVSTVDIPDDRIRKFHKQALKIAMRGIDLFPLSRRRSSATLIAVNGRQAKELKELIDSFHQRLQVFVENCADESDADELMQVLVHLTPVGGKNV